MASQALATELKEASYGYEDSRFEKNVNENFHCSICRNVLKEPRMCRNNEHIFCLDCITKHLNVNSQTCPECNEHLSAETLRRPRLLNNLLSKLKIICDYASRGCSECVRVEDLKTHVENCGFAPVLCSNEKCGMEINKQERIYHEIEVCDYRKVKCRACGQTQQVVGRVERRLTEIEKNLNEKTECIKQELEVVKEDLKENFSKVKKDLHEVKFMMRQMLKNLEMLQVPTSTVGLHVPAQTVGTHFRPAFAPFGSHYGPPTIMNPQINQRQPFPATPASSPLLAMPGQRVCVPRHNILVQASAADQKRMLAQQLFPLIQGSFPEVAGKITDLLLENDIAELQHMLEFPFALAAKVNEAWLLIQQD